MQVGTAGLTAMLSIMALERQGVTPDQGEVLVTGASGCVGLFAIALLSKLGYRVIASSGKYQALEAELLGLGAVEVMDRLPESRKPLQSERWAGAIDPVGGQSLSTMLTQMKYGSAIATCGLAGGYQLNSSVYPFILRGVSLIGIDSVYCPQPLRKIAWDRIAHILDDSLWQQLNSPMISLTELPQVSQELLAGKRWGRTVIDCQRNPIPSSQH
ncbi:MAG: zinc-binding dehydrogenase, partial [Acaryochloridaceae cyanobacterium RL_2_7]|nr:zinc-binding dehydrogenase [Acaryochloridaceae cyanobacterium RL_2_7]